MLILLDGERDARIAASHGAAARAALGPHLTLDGTRIATLLRRGAPATVPLSETARALVVPLQSGGRIAGGLVVVRTGAGAGDDAALLTAFGRRSAVALGKVEARQTEARRASQLALLAGASEIAASTLDLDVMLGAVARYIQQSFGYYSVSIYVVDRLTRSSVLAGSAGVAAQVMPLAHRIDVRPRDDRMGRGARPVPARQRRAEGAALLRRPHDGHALRAGGAGAAGRRRGGGGQRGERPDRRL